MKGAWWSRGIIGVYWRRTGCMRICGDCSRSGGKRGIFDESVASNYAIFRGLYVRKSRVSHLDCIVMLAGSKCTNYWYSWGGTMQKNTSITLGQHFDAFIAEQLKSGRYSSTSEVVRAGL